MLCSNERRERRHKKHKGKQGTAPLKIERLWEDSKKTEHQEGIKILNSLALFPKKFHREQFFFKQRQDVGQFNVLSHSVKFKEQFVKACHPVVDEV